MAEPFPKYDPTNADSITEYALRLQDRTLRSAIGDDAVKAMKGGKGGFGNLVEEQYFQYKANSDSRPDFPIAGVELKTTPIKRNKKRFAAKERLVLNTINYSTENVDSFEGSSFWSKNSKLLLMMYLNEAGLHKADMLFKIIQLYEFPPKDLEIIKEDWRKIATKIKHGNADQLSEGDTLYLAACTKGAKGKELSTMRKQSGIEQKAPQRAYSLKQSYMNFIVDRSGLQASFVPAVDIKELKKGKTFEQIIIERFSVHYGKSEDALWSLYEMPFTKAKQKRAMLCNAIMGAKGKRHIEELEKANATIKTVVVNPNTGMPLEDMSFQQIRYAEVVNEDWEDSAWQAMVTKRILFVVFEGTKKNPILKKAFFWTMPQKDLIKAKKIWEDTRSKIQTDNFEQFAKSSETGETFIRTKGRDEQEKRATPSGGEYKNLAYWFARRYVRRIIEMQV